MLSDDDVEKCRQAGFAHGGLRAEFCFESAARAIESAACAERDARIAELERQLEEARKDAERLTAWREKIIKASEQAYGESAIRYKFSLTKNGKCINTFPKEIDGRWFALVPAEDDGHIGHIARIESLKRVLEQSRDALAWCVEQGGGPVCEHESGGAVCFCKETQAIAAIDAAIKEQT